MTATPSMVDDFLKMAAAEAARPEGAYRPSGLGDINKTPSRRSPPQWTAPNQMPATPDSNPVAGAKALPPPPV